jgi:hypothetical protein
MQSKRTAAPPTAAAAVTAAADASSSQVATCCGLLELAFATATTTPSISPLNSRHFILIPAAAAACARITSRFPSVLPRESDLRAELALSSARVKPDTKAAAADATWDAQAASSAAAVGGWGREDRGRTQRAHASATWVRVRGRLVMRCWTREGKRPRGAEDDVGNDDDDDTDVDDDESSKEMLWLMTASVRESDKVKRRQMSLCIPASGVTTAFRL